MPIHAYSKEEIFQTYLIHHVCVCVYESVSGVLGIVCICACACTCILLYNSIICIVVIVINIM